MSATGRMWQRNWRCDSGCEGSPRLCTVNLLVCGVVKADLRILWSWSLGHCLAEITPDVDHTTVTKTSEDGSRAAISRKNGLGGPFEGLWVDLSIYL
jgi:hypothetical protein